MVFLGFFLMDLDVTENFEIDVNGYKTELLYETRSDPGRSHH